MLLYWGRIYRVKGEGELELQIGKYFCTNKGRFK